MTVRVSVLLAIVALSSLFVLRGLTTVLPALFAAPAAGWAATALLLTATLLLVACFTTLRERLAGLGKAGLIGAASIGLAGAGVGALVELRELLVRLSLATESTRTVHAAALGELAAAVALLWFFVAVQRHCGDRLRGVRGALAGWSFVVALTLAIFVLKVSGPGLAWLSAASYLPAIALAAVTASALGGLLRFLVLLELDLARPS